MDEKKDMVSVIIPVYNCESSIDECVQSIVDQTYKNLEIIIIDDGSTDNTYNKIVSWAKSDTRVRVFRQENQGSGPARNKGIEEAIGEYIAFLDGDDFWINHTALHEIMLIIKEKTYDVLGTFYSFYRDGKLVEIPRHREYFLPGEKLGKWIDFQDEQDCYGFCSYLYRKNFLKEHNIKFPSYLRFQDPPFLAKVLELTKRYYVLPIEWSSYRHRYKNVLSTSQKINDCLKGALDVVQIAHKHGMDRLKEDVLDYVNSFCNVIMKSILQGNMEALQLIAKLQEYVQNQKIENYPLQFIKYSLEMSCKKRADDFIQEVNNSSKLIIYGTGTYGRRFFETITKQNIQTEIIFAETNEPRNRVLYKKSCYKLKELEEYKEDGLVVISVKMKDMQNEMLTYLKEIGFKKYFLYSDELSTLLECAKVE